MPKPGPAVDHDDLHMYIMTIGSTRSEQQLFFTIFNLDNCVIVVHIFLHSVTLCYITIRKIWLKAEHRYIIYQNKTVSECICVCVW